MQSVENEKKNGRIIVVSGFSGAGKGTIIKAMLEKHKNYALSISATTRGPRNNEKEAVNYFFKTEEQFLEMIRNDEFLEYAKFVKCYYGTPKAYVEQHLAEGTDVILEIETQGALQVKKKRPDAIMVFITTPSAMELKNRLIGRQTESLEKVVERLQTAVVETDIVEQYDYVLVNDDYEKCADILNDIENHPECSSENYVELIKQIKSDLTHILEGE